MKKWLLILLSAVLAVSFPWNVSFAKEESQPMIDYANKGANAPIELSASGTNTLGVVFSPIAPVRFVGLVCPNYGDSVGSMTLTLYKWDRDYATTVAGNPVAGPKDFENFPDNANNGFEFPDAPLAKGIYYLEISDVYDEGGTGCGVWSANANYPGQQVLRDGEYVEKLQLKLKITFTEPVSEPYYGEMPDPTKVDNGLGGTSAEPCPYYFNLPELESVDSENKGAHLTTNEDGTLHVKVDAGTVDSQYGISFDEFFGFEDSIPCRDYPYMAMRVKLNPGTKSMGSGECFMYTTSVPGATGGYSAEIAYDYSNTDWQTVVIDPTSNASFVRNAVENEDEWLGFRFDMLVGTPNADFELDVQWIAFFRNEEAAMAFDGNFPEIPDETPTEEPTAAPTEEPTAAPTEEPTAAPTEEPSPTDAPATDAPSDEPKADKGCGSVIGGGFAAAFVLALAAYVSGKKH